MLLSIVLIKYKYFNFAQGSRILTILTYSYTIKNQYLIKISLIVKVCYKSLHINIGNKGDCFAQYFIFVVLTPSFITIWEIRMLAFYTFFWWAHDHVMIYGPNSCNRRDLITLLWIAYPLLFAYSLLLDR